MQIVVQCRVPETRHLDCVSWGSGNSCGALLTRKLLLDRRFTGASRPPPRAASRARPVITVSGGAPRGTVSKTYELSLLRFNLRSV